MTLKDLKISTQLKMGVSAVLLMVLILAVMAWFQTDRLWHQTRILYDHPLEVRRAIGNLKTDILIIHWSMEKLFSQYNDVNKEQILPLIKAHESSARSQFQILMDRYSGNKENVETLYRAAEECRINREQVIQLLQTGDIDKAQAINIHSGIGPDTPHLQQVMNLLQRLDDSSHDYAQQYFENASAYHRSMVMQMISAMAVIIVLTGSIGFLLYKRINQPLKELTSLTDKFRNGDYNVRSGNKSSNELGTLASGFNQMADSISHEMELRTTNEHISKTLLEANEVNEFRKKLLHTLIEATDSQMGVYFKLNTVENVFEPSVSMGIDQQRLKPFDAATLEGELGKVLSAKKMILLQDIPEDSIFHFRTFAGTLQPKAMISFPIVIDNAVRAVITLASIKTYTATAVETMSQPWSTLVHTAFSNLLANDETLRLSEELQEYNQELQNQQQELESQAEELVKQTEELQVQNMELEQQRLAVEEATRLKSQFLSNMSHELRTPLNSVMALSHVLIMQAGSKLSQEEVSYLEIIQRNGKNLLSLINDLLDLSKIESGKMEINPRSFALDQTINNMVESIMPLAKEKGVNLNHKIPSELPNIESDEMRVSQVLQNLLSNAVKFTDEGEVQISMRTDQDQVYIQVQDTGIGMTRDELKYIFDEFRQVDGSSSRKFEGTGLGLTIAHKTATMLGGDITVKSTPDKGSCFTLILPLRWQGSSHSQEPAVIESSPNLLVHQETFKTQASELSPHSSRPAENHNILLVEDNESAIIQVRSALESAGYKVDVARDGQEALNYVSRSIPDGIILDLMMPNVDGFEVLEKIRGTSSTANIPVLILTAKDLTHDDFKRLSANNIQQLVQKGDVNLKVLLSKISLMLKEDYE